MPKGVYIRSNARTLKFCLECQVQIDWRSTYCMTCRSKGSRNPMWKGGFDKSAYQARYYEEHKSTILNQVTKWKTGRLAQIRELLDKEKNKPCADCNQQYPFYVMDFDHVKGEKKFNLGQAMGLNYALETIKEEIDKCEIVCSNCHRERTYGGGKSSRKNWLSARLSQN